MTKQKPSDKSSLPIQGRPKSQVKPGPLPGFREVLEQQQAKEIEEGKRSVDKHGNRVIQEDRLNDL